MAVTTEDVVAWVVALGRVYSEHQQYLTDLDAAIGDADHGWNMDRGFGAAGAALVAEAPPDIETALKTVATVLIRTVGGASGPLYGTFFLRAASACAGKTSLAPEELAAAIRAGIGGVEQRGKAALGDKTMLDALIPARDAIDRALGAGADCVALLEAAASAAEAGMTATIPLVARKGRASYLGERSAGHQDPGATSSYLLLRTAAETWRRPS